ncbi:HD domain-containing protein [Desulfosarcina sp.]|nr:HD domain-containing protein [Desulfosarcina sp.]
MNLPKTEDCVHLINVAFRVPANIVNHSIQVNRLAVFIANKLNEKGEKVNIDLVDKASILHDMLKIVEIYNPLSIFKPPGKEDIMVISKEDRIRWAELKEKYGSMKHEEAAYTVLNENFPELALVIRKHGYQLPKGDLTLNTWEEKLIFYSDKRVMHSDIVSLKERLKDGHLRYAEKNKLIGVDQEKQDKIDNFIFDLEKQIFNKLDFGPDEVLTMIEGAEKHE